MAKERIRKNPARYIDRIYGETEVGGTSWMYLSGVPFEDLGFITVPDHPTPKLAETIQHSLFSYLWSPILLFGILSGVMYTTGKDAAENRDEEGGKP